MKTNSAVLALALAAGLLVPVAAATADPMETVTFAGPYGVFVSSGNPSNTTLSATFTAEGYPPGGVRIMMDLVTGVEGTLLSDVTVLVTPPTGDPFEVSMGDPEVITSNNDVLRIVPLTVGINPAGTWTFRIYDSSQQGDGVAAEETVSNVRLSIESAVPPNPTFEMGTLTVGTATFPGQILGANAVHWASFTVPALNDIATPRYLDMFTSGPFVDSYIGVYDSNGRVMALDDDSGTGRTSFLSFGYGGGSTVGGGGPSDFQTISDGRSGKLAPGDYWLAIAEYGGGAPIFNPGWYVQPAFEGSGFSYAMTVILGDTPPGGNSPPPATGVGTLVYTGGIESLATGSVEVSSGATSWLSFTTGPVSVAEGTYLDIVTDASSTLSDPEIGLYNALGVLAGADDDDGPDFAAFLSFGAGGGTTNGGAEPGAAVSDGRDGNLTAGTYYLAVGEYNTTFANGFNQTVVGEGSGGAAVVNFLTGRVDAPGGCGPADIGIAGGLPGFDGVLDNNDFISFINLFFGLDPLADRGAAGGVPGHDGLFDNNDFIVFITQFFEGC